MSDYKIPRGGVAPDGRCCVALVDLKAAEAEIERLRAVVSAMAGEALAIYKPELDAKDAEIERLKAVLNQALREDHPPCGYEPECGKCWYCRALEWKEQDDKPTSLIEAVKRARGGSAPKSFPRTI